MTVLRLVKMGEAPPSSTGTNADAPIPAPSITPTQAPGKRGPVGMGPRTNYSHVNSGLPPVSDAGASAQKSMPPQGAEMLPKLASGEEFMGNLAGRTSLGTMVKSAVAQVAERVRVTNEAHLQSVKTAEKDEKECRKCGKEKCACTDKTASREIVTDDLVEKLANACEYGAELLRKEAAGMGGAYNLSESKVGNPPGVSEASGGATLKDHHGQGVNIVPKNPGEQKGLPTEHSATQMDNTLDHGVPGKMPANIVSEKKASALSPLALIREKLAAEKTAAPEAEKKETEGMAEAAKGLEKAEKAHASEPENKKEGAALSLVDGLRAHIKQAEDAINPAQISAGAAVPPDTSAAGQPGGEPVGGAPKGPTSLVASNEAAQNYTKGQSHGPRREELGKYFSEPALSMAHDSTLRDVLDNTGKAGTKFASADAGISQKTAAARVLLSRLATAIQETDANKTGA
jgi:hypothetical protein